MPMKSLSFLAIISVLALAISLAIASDPTPLQDICVGVNTPADGVYVNGKFCKDPKLATINDFSFSGLQNTQPVNNPTRTGVLLVTADTLPGLNTLGLSFARADFAVNGTIAPHTHPRASEILAVQQGSVLVGFVTEEQSGNRLFTKTLNAGDLILFPQGLIHFASNVGRVPAVAFAALNSQNPGIVFVPNTVFGSNPPIDVNVLSESFNLPPSIIMSLQAYF